MVQGPSFGIASFGLAFLSKTPQLRVAGLGSHGPAAFPTVRAHDAHFVFGFLDPTGAYMDESAMLEQSSFARASHEFFPHHPIRVEDLSGCGHPNYGYRRDKPTANAIATGIDSTERENITPAPFGFPSVGLKSWGIGIQVRHSKAAAADAAGLRSLTELDKPSLAKQTPPSRVRLLQSHKIWNLESRPSSPIAHCPSHSEDRCQARAGAGANVVAMPSQCKRLHDSSVHPLPACPSTSSSTSPSLLVTVEPHDSLSISISLPGLCDEGEHSTLSQGPLAGRSWLRMTGDGEPGAAATLECLQILFIAARGPQRRE
ncbi:hypothetical protein CH63R_04302 [Colletotrichum higginsianum IMI 349063]|uniref:Uncharacterized protein n=1 Tax=Colletotrichum higginsianum (strain IMI 349063) TaxID=759273 RepID=A0A1B7YIY5_COLHI|nr:hypothetical protein CH63R_04302 [Colletotrichum higginsianum IMI 349063]OBR12006.1 hypothetical protein CH63R_04302 [Colletotrichum higginsianum IMI 349063]